MEAAEEVAENQALGFEEALREAALREELWNGIQDIDPTAVRNASGAPVLANTLNVSFPGCDGETLLMGLDLEGVAVSSGSACMVGSIQASHVLLAMGVSEDLARATVRFSLGRETTLPVIQGTLKALTRVLNRQSRFTQT
jgi:cysteine desulfurase